MPMASSTGSGSGLTASSKKETVIRLVGKLDNIDAEMLEKEKLQDMSRIDQLTGVYNKAGFKTVVEPLLKESGSGSFIFTDLDNFQKQSTIP